MTKNKIAFHYCALNFNVFNFLIYSFEIQIALNLTFNNENM
jgi:hypothetical protein